MVAKKLANALSAFEPFSSRASLSNSPNDSDIICRYPPLWLFRSLWTLGGTGRRYTPFSVVAGSLASFLAFGSTVVNPKSARTIAGPSKASISGPKSVVFFKSFSFSGISRTSCSPNKNDLESHLWQAGFPSSILRDAQKYWTCVSHGSPTVIAMLKVK